MGEWDICGDRFYAKTELYKMQWKDINLDQLRYRPVPFCTAHQSVHFCVCALLRGHEGKSFQFRAGL